MLQRTNKLRENPFESSIIKLGMNVIPEFEAEQTDLEKKQDNYIPIAEEEDELLQDFMPYNTSTVVEYQDLVYKNMQIDEHLFDIEEYLEPGATVQNLKSNYREIVVDWLFRVSDELHFNNDTYYSAISLFDRIVSVVTVKKCHIQLYGATAMWISSKIVEMLTPALSDFIFLCGNAYTEQDFIECELVILSTLDFSFATSTPYFYLRPFLDERDMYEVELYAFFFLNSATFSPSYKNMSPSNCAAACLFLAYSALNLRGKLFPNEPHVDVATVAEYCALIAQSATQFIEKQTGAVLDQLVNGLSEIGKELNDDLSGTLLNNVNDEAIISFCAHQEEA